jgi:hypothetical protein
MKKNGDRGFLTPTELIVEILMESQKSLMYPICFVMEN